MMNSKHLFISWVSSFYLAIVSVLLCFYTKPSHASSCSFMSHMNLPFFFYKKWPISTTFCLHLTDQSSFLCFHWTALCFSIYFPLFWILFSCYSSSLLKTRLHASTTSTALFSGGLVKYFSVCTCSPFFYISLSEYSPCFLYLKVSLSLFHSDIPPRFPVTGLVVCCTQFRCAKSKRATQQKRKIAISQKCRFKTVIFLAVINISPPPGFHQRWDTVKKIKILTQRWLETDCEITETGWAVFRLDQREAGRQNSARAIKIKNKSEMRNERQREMILELTNANERETKKNLEQAV